MINILENFSAVSPGVLINWDNQNKWKAINKKGRVKNKTGSSGLAKDDKHFWYLTCFYQHWEMNPAFTKLQVFKKKNIIAVYSGKAFVFLMPLTEYPLSASGPRMSHLGVQHLRNTHKVFSSSLFSVISVCFCSVKKKAYCFEFG